MVCRQVCGQAWLCWSKTSCIHLINSKVYMWTLQKLQAHLHCVQPCRCMHMVLLKHDTARPHTSLKTTEAIRKTGWTVLPCSSFCPNLVPLNYQLSWKLKDRIHGIRSADDGCLVKAGNKKSGWRTQDQHFTMTTCRLLIWQVARRLSIVAVTDMINVSVSISSVR